MSSLQNKPTEESELEEIRKGFQMFDTNGTGLVNPSEIKEAMESMNMQEKNPFLFEIISSLSTSEDFKNKEGISIDDLVNYVYEKVNDNESNIGLKQLFDALKDPGSNTISMHTFMKLARDYDEDDLSGDELRYLLEKTQLGGDELTFEEFCTIMKGGAMSSASVRSEEPDYDKNKIIPMDNNNISEEIKEEVIDTNKNDSVNNINENVNESKNDNVNIEENQEIKENPENNEKEIEIKNEEIINTNDNVINGNKEEIKAEILINNDNINNNENNLDNKNIIIENIDDNKKEEKEENNLPSIKNENEIKIISPIPLPFEQVKIEEEHVQKEDENPGIKNVIIEQKIEIEQKPIIVEEKPKIKEKPKVVEEKPKIIVKEKPKIVEEKHEIIVEEKKIEQKPKEVEKSYRFRFRTKMADKPNVEEKPKIEVKPQLEEKHKIEEKPKIQEKVEKKVEVNVIRSSNFNNNQITEIKSTETKDEKGAKKYNRFRRFNINKDSNENNNVNNDINTNVKNNATNKIIINNANTEIRYSYYKKEVPPKKEIVEEKPKKETVEEKHDFKRNVYRTKRAYNTGNNNNENKQEEKKEVVEEKKETVIPRRYHRRYRENKGSTNA